MLRESDFNPQILKLKESTCLKGHTGAVLNCKFSKNGNYCVTTSQDKSLILWNPHKQKLLKRYQGVHNYDVNDVAITADNAKLASVGGDKIAFLWDVLTGKIIRKLLRHDAMIYACAMDSDSKLLITASADKNVCLWDITSSRNNKPVQILKEAKDSVTFVTITGAHKLITASIDGSVRCYDIRRGILSIDTFPDPVVRGDLTKDNRCYVINTLQKSNNVAYFVELETGVVLNVFSGHQVSQYPINPVFSPDDTGVVSGSEDGKIFFWDICSETGNPDIVKAAEMSTTDLYSTNVVFTLRFHPDQWMLLSCHKDGISRIWEPAC